LYDGRDTYDFEGALANAATGPPPVDPDELEHAYFAACRPKDGYDIDPEHRVPELVPPTPAQLQRHLEKFMPPEGRKYADARRLHRIACDEVASLYKLASDDIERFASELRREGASVAEIAKRCGVPERKARMIVRGARRRGSGREKLSARSA